MHVKFLFSKKRNKSYFTKLGIINNKKQTMIFFDLISLFDFFKEPILLNYKSKEHTSTILSISLSFLLYVYLLYSFSAADMIQKEKPIIVSQTLTLPHANPVIFDQNKHFSIGLSDSDNINIIDPSIFSITAGYFEYRNDESGTSQLTNATIFPMEVCNESHVSFDPSIFQKLGLKNQLCLPNRRFTLEGNWDESGINLVRIIVKTCDNSTFFNKCKTADEIETFFQEDKFFNIFKTLDFSFEVRNNAVNLGHLW